jgi:phosphomannomutase
MKIQTIKFGNDGWRAVVGEYFNEENLFRVAEAFLRYLHSEHLNKKPVAIGYDGRKDSGYFAEQFAGVLSAGGITVYLSETLVPTPVLSFSVKNLHCGAGIMITASHNPSSYNGVKFKAGYGGPFIAEETRKVAGFVQNIPVKKFDTLHIERKNFLPEYLVQLRKVIDFEALSKYAANPSGNPSVIIDSMGGAGQTILEEILNETGWRA